MKPTARERAQRWFDRADPKEIERHEALYADFVAAERAAAERMQKRAMRVADEGGDLGMSGRTISAAISALPLEEPKP